LTTNYQFHEKRNNLKKEYATDVNVSVLSEVVYVKLERYHYRLYV